MHKELNTLRKLTQMIVDNPMEMEYDTIIKATLNALPYPIFIMDSLYTIKFTNNYLSLYFNMDPSQIINKKYTDILFKSSDSRLNTKLNNMVGIKDPLNIPEMKRFPIFNKKDKTIGYVCIVSTKQNLNYEFELKQSILYANSILSTTTFNSKSIAVQCDWKNNLVIKEIFSSTNKSNDFSWLKGKSYVDDITYISDRQKVESFIKMLEKDENKNMIWNSRIYNKKNVILPVQQYMSLQNGDLLVHVASNDDGNIEIELS